MSDEIEVTEKDPRFRRFSSIGQFSNIVKWVRDNAKWNNTPLPTIKFSGSAKSHGTNAAVGMNSDGDMWFQSRERILSYESDNAGFCTWGMSNAEQLKKIFSTIGESLDLEYDKMYIYGEWCCGNIQKRVALNQIPEKKWLIFDIVLVDKNGDFIPNSPLDFHHVFTDNIENVFVMDHIVPPVIIEIDFNDPSSIQNKLVELTLAVENECPIGKYFGVSGVGEGLVFTAIGYDDVLMFKSKGLKHSSSKVKTIKELSSADIAKKESAAEFVEYACSENRLKQGIDKLSEMGLQIEMKSMGEYLRWVGQDVLREEIDVLIESGLERKDVMPVISNKARTWFIHYIDESLELL